MAKITTRASVGGSILNAFRSEGANRKNSIMGGSKFDANKSKASEKKLDEQVKSLNRLVALAEGRNKLELMRQRDEAEWRKLQERSSRQRREVSSAFRDTSTNLQKAFPVLGFFSKLFGPLGSLLKGIFSAGKLVINSFKLMWTWGTKLVKVGKTAVDFFRVLDGSKHSGIHNFLKTLTPTGNAAAQRLARMQAGGLGIGGKSISTGAKMLGGAAKFAKALPWVGTALMAGTDVFSAIKTQRQIKKYGSQLSEKENIMLKNQRNSQIGGAVGGVTGAAIGSIFGPVGTMVGQMIGKAFGEYVGKNFRKLKNILSETLDWAWNNSWFGRNIVHMFSSKAEDERRKKEFEERSRKRKIELEKEKEALEDEEGKNELDEKLAAFGLTEKDLKSNRANASFGGVDWSDIKESQIGTRHFQNRYRSTTDWSADKGAYAVEKTTYTGGRSIRGSRTGASMARVVNSPEALNLTTKMDAKAWTVNGTQPVFSGLGVSGYTYPTNMTPEAQKLQTELSNLQTSLELTKELRALVEPTLAALPTLVDPTKRDTATNNSFINLYSSSPESFGNNVTNDFGGLKL